MNLADRLLTIVVTATLTSAVWIVAGGSLIENASSDSQRERTRPSEAQPSPGTELENGGDPALAEASADYVEDSVQQAMPAVGQSIDGIANATETRQLVVPVLNVRRADLTDTYTASRGGGERLHEAIDIMAPTGTSVIAAAPGTIEKLFVSDAGGNTIYVRSADKRTIHYYAHLDKYAEGLKEGQRVRRGQRLGTVGSSGNASVDAPHLHFAIMRTTPDAQWWEPSSPVNPYPLLVGEGTE